jgi:hypothetical protein
VLAKELTLVLSIFQQVVHLALVGQVHLDLPVAVVVLHQLLFLCLLLLQLLLEQVELEVELQRLHEAQELVAQF